MRRRLERVRRETRPRRSAEARTGSGWQLGIPGCENPEREKKSFTKKYTQGEVEKEVGRALFGKLINKNAIKHEHSEPVLNFVLQALLTPIQNLSKTSILPTSNECILT
jgi:hypothetical protein